MAEKNTEKQRAAEQQLAEIAKITDEELFKRLDTDEEGLNQVEASDRLEEYGANMIDTGNENSLAKRVREAIINPFNIECKVNNRNAVPMHKSPSAANNTGSFEKAMLSKIAKHNRRHKMKATGIVRRIDDLGRVVIPKEIRRTMRIRMGAPSLKTLTQDMVFCMSVESAAERYIGK